MTSRGNARGAVARDETDRQMCLTVLTQVVDCYGWLCHAYCMLDNHYHLLIETPLANLSQDMRQLNGCYTKRITAGITGSVISSKGDSRRFWWKKSRIARTVPL